MMPTMKRNLLPYIITTALIMFMAIVDASGQATIRSLEEEIRRAEEEIRINTELLEKTRQSQKTSQSQLKLIQSRITSRRNVLNSLEKQISLLNDDISSKNKSIHGLNADLEKLKQEYADMVRAAYKNYKLNNFMLFLFAADDFNDITRRVNFMRRYNRMRVSKAGEIRQLSDSISKEIQDLDQKKSELGEARQSKNKELTDLGKDESAHKTTVNKLKAEESKLSKEVKAKQAQIEKAQKRIQEIIAEEARKNQKEVRTEAEDKYIAALSGKFDDNKGKLPYPVRGGVIIDRYGTHSHPTQKGLMINNKGVNIAANRGSAVTCVFEGTVSKVFSVPGMNNCVMVRHGNYITLYANMASVSVKAGDKVSLNQQVGKLLDSANSDDVYLHFEVWKETTNLNPEQWLRR